MPAIHWLPASDSHVRQIQNHKLEAYATYFWNGANRFAAMKRGERKNHVAACSGSGGIMHQHPPRRTQVWIPTHERST